MKRMIFTGMMLLLAFVMSAATVASAAGGADLAGLRAATEKYKKLETAMADGYNLIPGLDYCFENPGVGAMGYHYIVAAELDTSLDALAPEAMVYFTAKNGKLRLGAVEYIVPAAAWDAERHGGPPQVMGRDLHLNTALGVYVLHAWVWRSNPNGIFADWNPRVSCP